MRTMTSIESSNFSGKKSKTRNRPSKQVAAPASISLRGRRKPDQKLLREELGVGFKVLLKHRQTEMLHRKIRGTQDTQSWLRTGLSTLCFPSSKENLKI